jgi:hypothetical protein
MIRTGLPCLKGANAATWLRILVSSGVFRTSLCGAAMAAFLASGAMAQPVPPPRPAVEWPGADHDPAIPTLRAIAGHDPGTELARHADVERYPAALNTAAPDRTRLMRHGTSVEGRALSALFRPLRPALFHAGGLR